MDLRQMKYFETVAKLGNISKAAEKLKMTQPPLSQQIHCLENELGVKLFERRKQGMFLTNEGFLFLEQIAPLLNQFDNLIKSWTGMKNPSTARKLTIATLPGFSGILSKALHIFRSTNPNIMLSIREGFSPMIFHYLINQEAQIGITRLPIMNSALDYTLLGSDRICAFLKDNDPLASKDLIMPKDLKNRLLLLIQTNAEYSQFTRVLELLEEAAIRPKIAAYAETIMTILQLVRLNMGIGLVPTSAVHYMPAGVKMLPFNDTPVNIPTAVIWRKGESDPLAIEAKNIIIKYCSIS